MNPEIQSQTNDVNVKAEPSEANLQSSPSDWSGLRKTVENNPYSEAAWNGLLDKAEESGDLEKIKEAYEALLEKYPNTSSAQISYLTHFLTNQATFPFAESLFARFLRTSASVDLWKFYIIYVRRLNVGPTTRDTVAKAYDFALQHVGQDKDSSGIWEEYIQFVKSGEASSTWEEQQKMDTLRKIYQRAVQIPLENVEMLWKDYEAFENSLNKITAKKFLQDLTAAHMQARSKLRELRRHLGPLLPPAAPTSGRVPLNLPRKPTYSPEDRALVGAWKSYLKWEEGNPVEIEDKAALTTRLQGVYRKAVVRMRFFGEIWFMAYTWTAGVGRSDEALTILKAGVEANATSFVLNFALAEALERAKNFTEVHATFTRLLQGMHEELEEAEAKAANVSENSSFSDAIPESAGNADHGADAENRDTLNGNSLSKEASIYTTKTSSSSSSAPDDPPAIVELRERKQEYGLVYIMYIRFAMRSEGLDASRAVFSKARKDKWASWEVFEAAALMEYHVAKQAGVANRILGVALNRFKTEVDFVVRYLAFLMSVNDENNARALFEQTVGTFPPKKARPLWERWARYEYQYGDLDAALKLEKRMAEVYPDDPPIKRFAQRHLYLGIDGIANRDLGVSETRKAEAARIRASQLVRSDTLPVISTSTAPSQSYGTGSLAHVGANASFKRGASPEREPRERERRREDIKPPHKRARDASPPPRERWSGPGGVRRYGSPAWPDRERFERVDRDHLDRERHRDRERSPPRRHAPERDEPPRPVIPQVLSWFVGQLPPPASFDGPIFRTDDLMQLFRSAVIPGSNAMRSRSPPPPPRATRPPPDYGPYRGPGGRGGRY